MSATGHKLLDVVLEGGMMPAYRPLADRFWEKVAKADSCWLWTASKSQDGYGNIGIAGRRTALAHRVAWELSNGPIPDGMFVLHRCDNPPCVNPDHLWLGTNADNMADMARKGRASRLPRRVPAERRARGRRNGHYTMPDRTPKGSDHKLSRLTESDVREMRKLWDAGGVSQLEIGRRFNINGSVARLVVLRLAWRHVT